jgi:autotransporter-associated beta strand protein
MKLRVSALFASAIVCSLVAPLRAATFTWNGSTTGGGTGASDTWDTTAVNWTGAGTVWPTTGTDNDAVFAGTAGTVTIASGVTANDITFSTAGYTISGGTLTLNGTAQTITNAATATISSVLAGTANLTKLAAGTLVLSGANTISGSLIAGIAQVSDPNPSIVNDGILRLTNSNAAGTATIVVNGGYQRGRLELSGNISVSNAITLQGRQSPTYSAITNQSGVNTISGAITVQANGGRVTFNSTSGSLTVSGAAMTGSSGRALTFRGAGVGLFSKNITSAVVSTLDKFDAGTWTVTGSNTHTGTNTVSGGTLNVTSPTGLGTGNVAISNATLNYTAATDAPLSIGGTLAIGVLNPSATPPVDSGGNIGASIGSSPTSASINVTGAAKINDKPHTVHIYGVPGATATTGTYTLVSGGVGSVLNPTAAPTLGKIYNNSSFTVGSLSRTATTLDVGITAATPLSNAYWVGGLTGATNVWAQSDGTATSNWAATAGGAAQALVPGSTTNVIISGDTPAVAPTATVLGADMTINSLTISDTTNGLGLNDDGYTLKLLADGLTVDADVPASSIGAKVDVGADQTWTINSANALTVSGVVSGLSSLTKAGSGTLALAAANTYSGTTQVTAGTLSLANLSALAGSTLYRDPNDTGVLSYDVAGATTYNLGGLSGAGTLDAGGKTLSIGGNNQSTEFSGDLSNGALTKVGSGTLTLSGASTFAGAVNVNAGRLTLTNSDALGNGPKAVSMQGTNRQIHLANDITIPSDVTFVMSSNSGDGNGLNNESGNNTIQGPVNISFGNPALNISAADGTLTISGNVTLITSARPLQLGGASEADNTISGNISENSAEVLPITKQGVGKWIFSGTNTYKGDTNVNAGTLVLANGGSQRFYPKTDGTCNKITGTGGGSITLNGALDIDLTNANTASSWTLVDVANVVEAYGDNFTVTGFTETPAASGVWKKTVGADAYTFTEADGLLTRAAAPAGFTSWVATPAFGLAVGDQDPTDDPDNDGIENLVEYVLNGVPNASDQNILPTLNASGANFVFTFTRQASSAGDTTQVFQYGNDLTGWTDVPVINGGEVAITPDTPSAGLDQVVITVAKGTNTKLFGRLKVSRP